MANTSARLPARVCLAAVSTLTFGDVDYKQINIVFGSEQASGCKRVH